MDVSPTVKFRSQYGIFDITSFATGPCSDHAVLTFGDVTTGEPVLIRIQSACMTGTALKGMICDCAAQLDASMQLIVEDGRGIVIYLDEEARGHGLAEKLKGMAEVAKGADTVTAFTNRGLAADMRTYSDVGPILDYLGSVKSLRPITNNPGKLSALEDHGYTIAERIPADCEPTEFTKGYLETKKNKLGHIISTVD